jgi:hypothetical protein
MSDPLSQLVQQRTALLRQFVQLGDFQPGSVVGITRRCGKPNCRCAEPNAPGHGPHMALTRKATGKTVTQSLSTPAAVRKAERETAEFRRFQSHSRDLVQVNQQVCRLRPVEEEELTAPEKKRPKPSSKKSPAK